MSKMIPRRSIDAFRQHTDVALSVWGTSIDLYIPNNLTTIDTYDVYTKPEQFIYDHYICDIFIEWQPNTHKLKGMGIFVEDSIPILTRFPNHAVDDNGDTVEIDVVKNSFFKIAFEYIPAKYNKTDAFEVIDEFIESKLDASLVQYWRIAPLRGYANINYSSESYGYIRSKE